MGQSESSRALRIDRCFGANTAIEMILSELPAAVLDAVVECAGFDQGWRLEVVSTSLQATSMECCVARLGKCRWTAGDRTGTEFKPCWRHVAVALRRGPYYLLRHGSVYEPGGGQSHIRFCDVGDRSWLESVSRREAEKFTIRPASRDEATIHTVKHCSRREYRGNERRIVHERYDAHLSYLNEYAPLYAHGDPCMHLRRDENIPHGPTPWLLRQDSRASHLPFSCCLKSDGHRGCVFKNWSGGGYLCIATRWELAPATLADDERFEWRV